MVVIIAVLAAMMVGMFLRARAQSAVSASKGNLRNVAHALETYFTDTNAHPATLAVLIPTYARGIPDDPCTNAAYTYDISMGGLPPVAYKLTTNAYPLTNPCRIIVSGLSYTPAGGVEESP